MPSIPDQPIIDFGALTWSEDRPKVFERLPFTGDRRKYYESSTRVDARLTEYSVKPIPINGIEYTLVGIHEVMRGSRGDEVLAFFIGAGEELVELTIAIEQSSDGVWTHANLSRNNSCADLPRGLGRSLYCSLFPYLQTLANKRKKVVIDTVDKAPRLNTTNEDWDRMFLPILTQYGYKQISDHQFRQVYDPKAL